MTPWDVLLVGAVLDAKSPPHLTAVHSESGLQAEGHPWRADEPWLHSQLFPGISGDLLFEPRPEYGFSQCLLTLSLFLSLLFSIRTPHANTYAYKHTK